MLWARTAGVPTPGGPGPGERSAGCGLEGGLALWVPETLRQVWGLADPSRGAPKGPEQMVQIERLPWA